MSKKNTKTSCKKIKTEKQEEKEVLRELQKLTKLQTKRHRSLDKEIIKELSELTKAINKLKELEFIKILKHPFKLLWLSLLKGIMVGFGSILGATVLVAIFIYLLTQIGEQFDFVPYISDMVQEILNQLNHSSSTPVDSVLMQPAIQ